MTELRKRKEHPTSNMSSDAAGEQGKPRQRPRRRGPDATESAFVPLFEHYGAQLDDKVR